MVDLGPTQRFLGMDIDTMESGFAMYQTPYIESLLQRFKVTDAYGVDTPIDCNIPLEITENDTDKPVDQAEYLAIVGSLMHLKTAKRVLRYLKKTKELKLVYTKTLATCTASLIPIGPNPRTGNR